MNTMNSEDKIKNLSNSQIVNLTFIAIILTLIIVFIAYLPARYNKDFTGLGAKLGFVRLYQNHDEVETKIKNIQNDTLMINP